MNKLFYIKVKKNHKFFVFSKDENLSNPISIYDYNLRNELEGKLCFKKKYCLSVLIALIYYYFILLLLKCLNVT